MSYHLQGRPKAKTSSKPAGRQTPQSHSDGTSSGLGTIRSLPAPPPPTSWLGQPGIAPSYMSNVAYTGEGAAAVTDHTVDTHQPAFTPSGDINLNYIYDIPSTNYPSSVHPLGHYRYPQGPQQLPRTYQSTNIALSDNLSTIRNTSTKGDGSETCQSCSSASSRSSNLFNGASNVKTKNSNFHIVQGNVNTYANDDRVAEDARVDAALATLHAHCAPRAALSSDEVYDKPSCAEETRVAAQETLIAWVTSLEPQALMGWLCGPAGAGKSTIAQTVAKKLHELGLLGASFFFSRTSPGGSAERADGRRLIPTIVSHLVREFRALRPYVAAAIREDPDLFTDSRTVQLQKLLIGPLRLALSNSGGEWDRQKGRLIVIDGLDECSDAVIQDDIIKVIARALPKLEHPFRFLIVSRPEANIKTTFALPLVESQIRAPFPLDLANDEDADKDINRYLQLEFHRMHLEFGESDLKEDWPPARDIEMLVKRSTKQFIYPSTAARFIWDSEYSPVEALKMILDLNSAKRHNENPFATLDELYSFILLKVHEKNQDLTSRLFSLLGSQDLLPSYNSSTGSNTSRSSLAKWLRMTPVHLTKILKPLHSLINVPKPGESTYKMYVYHATLLDFLKDPDRSRSIAIRISDTLACEMMVNYVLDCKDRLKVSGMNDAAILNIILRAPKNDNLSQIAREYNLPKKPSWENPFEVFEDAETTKLFNVLDRRTDLNLHRHHVNKAKKRLEFNTQTGQLIFDMPPHPFVHHPILGFRNELYYAMLQFCALRWPSCSPFEHRDHKLQVPEAHLIVIVARDDRRKKHFTLDYIRGIQGNLVVEESEEHNLELRDEVQKCILVRLKELTRTDNSQLIVNLKKRFESSLDDTSSSTTLESTLAKTRGVKRKRLDSHSD